ncbi:mercury(II) reductase [Patescibacteria group bacterium]|nr:mercury(II) reductase [Patescibacteria group bacterium]
MNKYDLIIIGGGAGAFAAAIRANELKTKTLLVNAGLPLGGTCVNVGCVPSKTLLWAGEVMHQAKNHGIPGVELKLKNFDFQKVIQNELNLVERLRTEKYEKVLQSLEHVTFKEGKAEFVSPNEITVNKQRYAGERFVIATGSTANVPPIEGIKEVGYITHIEALRLKKQPKELIVVGAGPVGLEFAQMYSRFGTKVTILEYGPSIFGPGEPELISKLSEILTNEGITIYTGAKATKARMEKGKKVLTFEVQGKESEVIADEILLAAGKTPNTKELLLKKANVETDKKQAVIVNQFFVTSNPNIFAVGDVTNLPLRLETTAGKEGTLVAENAVNGSQNTIDYNAVPYAIFTDPQYASVGFTEDQQMKETGVCACRTVSFKDIPKAIVLNRTEGLIKMGIDPKTKQILGVHILAPNAGDLIAQAMMLVKNKSTIDDVINSLPVFPTMSEAIKIVALSFVKDISKLSCCV